ncbi:MAG: YmdB family metallophosphoesterase, partial [Acidobacteria bacterium]|nr:YmdB family metallophosphoesterase [Acidobacteriota bacterium]
MKILCLGDVVGEPGRRLLEAHLPTLRREHGVDFVMVNGENAAHGHGITEPIARQWFG